MKKIIKGVPDFIGDKEVSTYYNDDDKPVEDIFTKITRIESKLNELLELFTKLEIKEVAFNKLYSALSAAQAEMDDMKFSGTNTYYHDKYATLSDLVRMTRPALTKHGLAVYQHIYQDDNDVNYMKTVLAHSSGEKIESIMRITPNKNTVQQLGSYIAHIRRLCYASIVGCMVHSLEDDDGVACMEEYHALVEKGTLPSYTSKDTHSKDFERISRDELSELERSMGDHHDLGQQIMETYHLAGLADLPKSKYIFVLGQLRKNVARRNGDLL